MKKLNSIDIPSIFKSEAEKIVKSREKAIKIHGTNIRAAGNEVENSVREYYSRMLPKKYYVTQGHLIDSEGLTSPQIDLIIADNINLPSLMTTSDGTEYVPIDSVYAIGEIKSTYYKSKNYIEDFSDALEGIITGLNRNVIENTAYGGIDGKTLMRDVFLGTQNPIHNRLFTFMIFVDGGDFKPQDINDLYEDRKIDFLPNTTTLLDKGIIFYGTTEGNKFQFERYPEAVKGNLGLDWYFSPIIGKESGSLEGNHLAFIYHCLINHLANSYLEPPSLVDFLSQLLVSKKSETIKLNAT